MCSVTVRPGLLHECALDLTCVSYKLHCLTQPARLVQACSTPATVRSHCTDAHGMHVLTLYLSCTGSPLFLFLLLKVPTYYCLSAALIALCTWVAQQMHQGAPVREAGTLVTLVSLAHFMMHKQAWSGALHDLVRAIA
jgi:hypothetical protein